jgi:hypothetical protein
VSPQLPEEHAQYLDGKRQQFWQAQQAEQHVTLTDPSLAQCNLNSLAVAK